MADQQDDALDQLREELQTEIREELAKIHDLADRMEKVEKAKAAGGEEEEPHAGGLSAEHIAAIDAKIEAEVAKVHQKVEAIHERLKRLETALGHLHHSTSVFGSSG